MLREGRHKLNPAEILVLIRDRKAITKKDIIKELATKNENSFSEAQIKRYVDRIIDDLAKAGLIASSAEPEPTNLINAFQEALDISLAELSKAKSDAVIANPIFGNPAAGTATSDVFVVMPFKESLKPVYASIQKAANALGLTCERADEFSSRVDIISDIWSRTFHATVIVADCTTHNPNVFYEIGIAHTLGKPTILIAQSLEGLPFDLHRIKCIDYENSEAGLSQLEDQLASAIPKVLD